jgi:formylmethanofuran dehydrogenase subunit C
MSEHHERTVQGETVTVGGLTVTVELDDGIIVVRAGNIAEEVPARKLLLVISDWRGKPDTMRTFELSRRRNSRGPGFGDVWET